MDRKIGLLKHAETWATVPCPPGQNIVTSRWVFHLRRKSDGSINKFKAQLVMCRFTQVYRVDYYDTYSPVAQLTSFHMILKLTVCHDWEIEAFDFNSAYLNGKLGADDVTVVDTDSLMAKLSSAEAEQLDCGALKKRTVTR